MRHTWSFIAASCLLTVTLTVPLHAQSPSPGSKETAKEKTPNACREVEGACRQAGFVDKGSREGKGLWSECIEPIMQGRPQAKGAKLPLPKVSAEVVSACKTHDPSYGQADKPKSK